MANKNKEKKQRKPIVRVLLWIANVVIAAILLVVLICAGGLTYLSVTEFKPDAVETVEIDTSETSGEKLTADSGFTIMTWNAGYGALGDNADFFMDGGKHVYTADKDRVKANLNGDIAEFEKISPDIICVQETDLSSERSYFINQMEYFIDGSDLEALHGERIFAPNLKVAFIPVPIPPIGKVLSGLAMFSSYDISSADRLRLPCPFMWPVRTFNLKRCLQVARLPVEGSDKELVIINLHLEAYDSGEGKAAQTMMLKEVLDTELKTGNYIIACGDFNQVFSDADVSAYPTLEGKWQPGKLDVSGFDENLTFSTYTLVPSGRSIDMPLDTVENKDPDHFQYYVIDGFITSSNVEVESVYTDDLSFKTSDHNPMILKFKLN